MKTGDDPAAPHAARDTVRHEILNELRAGPRSAKELSAAVHVPEREVFDHLEHIRMTAAATGRHLVIIPAECRACGFVFRKRERVKGPGKCPICRSEAIHEPLYEIREKN